MEEMQDDDGDFYQLQVDEDEQVTSFGVDVYQQVFPVGNATQEVVVDGNSPSTVAAIPDDVARVERMRYLSGAFLSAGREWQDGQNAEARRRREQFRPKMNTLIGGPASVSVSVPTTTSE